MNRYILLLVFCFPAFAVNAQDIQGVRLTHYLFDVFSKGQVLKSSGSTSEQLLNYNALTGEMVFDANGQYLAISDVSDVDTVFILGRKFIPAEKEFYEFLLPGPSPLFIEYTCTIIEQGSEIGYGMSSKTSAANSIKSLIRSGSAYGLKLPDEYKISTGYNFLMRKDGNYEKIKSGKDLAKIFPDKKALINETVKQRNTNFSDKQDVIDLLQLIQR
jgi:hypothetical protein